MKKGIIDKINQNKNMQCSTPLSGDFLNKPTEKRDKPNLQGPLINTPVLIFISHLNALTDRCIKPEKSLIEDKSIWLVQIQV